jgi:hypothetical protein
MSSFKVSVSSNFEELWRYNLVLVCEVCSDKNERVEFLSQESFIAPVGSNLTSPPSDYVENRTLTLSTKEGNHLNILIYVLPHTLPTTDDVFKTKPFPLIVKVEDDKKEILVNQVFKVNQWSGDNIAINKVGAKD